MTKAYFKWDGRTGITAIIGISMIQVLIIGDVMGLAIRLAFDRTETAPYSKSLSGFFVIVLIVAIILNYIKYSKRYNEFRFRWKNETRRERITHGLLVIISLILPWVPLILIGIYW